ncbi:hypothetical protein N0V92_004413 [Colletotrichum tropicale]|nr:hypothetical protein N0V92_004413 [Colletotrichum tropicale]
MNEIISNAKMDPETGPSTETRPDVAPESAAKPTTELKAESATAGNRDMIEIMSELVIEPGAADTIHDVSQSTSESNSKASANSPSATEVPLPPSPPPPPGFSFSPLFTGSLSYTGKPTVPDAEGLAEPACSPFGPIPGPRPYEMHSKQIKADKKGKTIDISKWLQTTQESCESSDSCLLPSTLISATAASTVATEDSITALPDIDLSGEVGMSDDDTASYHTALERPDLRNFISDTVPIKSVCELEFLQDRDFSDEQLAIIGALDLSLQRDIPDAAEQAAAKIDSLCPPTDQEEEVEEWLWMLWEVFLDAVRSPTFYIQGRQATGPMLDILKCLQLRAKGTWSWKSLNAFAADCLGGSIGGPYDQAMYAMTTALEEEPILKYGVTACRIEVVREWIHRAGRKLFRWALENVGFDGTLEKDSPQYVEGGPLYHGPPMMCLQRWGFWIERLEQLEKKGSITLEVERAAYFGVVASSTASQMRWIERDMASTLSVSSCRFVPMTNLSV